MSRFARRLASVLSPSSIRRSSFILGLSGLLALTVCGPPLHAQSLQARHSAQPNRVLAQPSLRATTRLANHVPAWATAANDAGPVAPETSLHLTFVLTRSPELQAAFEQKLADLQDPASGSYHHWLTPQQIGTLCGPTQHDVDALTAWLTAQGFAVTDVAPSRTFVNVTAPVSTIAAALDTSFRTFQLDDPGQQSAAQPQEKSRIAITTAPAIPTAFAQLISSITGLAEIPIRPMHRATVVPRADIMPESIAAPRGTSGTTHYTTPNDFAVLYDLAPVYNSGITGASQKIAVIGRSRVLAADITNFETATGQAAKLPNIIVAPAGSDPGTTGTSDQGEATVDVQRAIGTAPGAQVDLVISATPSGGNDGIFIASQYQVQTLVDPIMNISFSACEAAAGASGVSAWDTLFAQAAAEGISVFVSSGDSGVNTCLKAGSALTGTQVRSINYICASSYATCIGGTQFNDTASPSTYWNAANGAGRESAISYIPEGAWNEPNINNNNSYVVYATGGGASSFIAKPSWQTGTGVPADGFRDVPDISLSASNHNGYLGCAAYLGSDCVNNFVLFSGTSTAAPGMAGIAALLNQRQGSAQGNLNPLLYRLAAVTPSAFHDATPATSGVSCDLNTANPCNNSLATATSLSGGFPGYALTTGYDQVTGLGSPDVANLLNAVATLPTFTLTAASSSLTVATGSTTGNTDALTLTSTNYAGSVALSCAVTYTGTGSPNNLPSCSLSPATVNLALNGTASSSLIIGTTQARLAAAAQTTSQAANLHPGLPAASAAHPAARLSAGPPSFTRFTLAGLSLGSLALLAFVPRRRRTLAALRSWSTLPIAVLLFAGLGALAACSGSSTPVTGNPLLLSASNVIVTPALLTIPSGGTDTFAISVVNVGFNTTVGAPTGTVQLFANSTPLGTLTLVNGKATSAAIPFTVAGIANITASYSGDTNFAPSSSAGTPITITSTGTFPGAYAVTVTATGAGGATATRTITLTVQ